MDKPGVRSYQNTPFKFVKTPGKTEYKLLLTGFIRKRAGKYICQVEFYKLSRGLCFSYGKPEPVSRNAQNWYDNSQQSIHDKFL